MDYIFNIDEIFEIAEQLEKNGAEFYSKAAAEVKDAEIRKLLSELAAMEAEHKDTFSYMRSQLIKGESFGEMFDPQGEAVLYLRALADTRIFFERQIDVSSAEEVLKEAIAAEKDSIVFYLGMKDIIPDDLGKEKMQAVIKEEMSHIRILSRQLMALKS